MGCRNGFDEIMLSSGDYASLCHNSIHTAVRYFISVTVIHCLFCGLNTTDAQTSRVAKEDSKHILYAGVYRKEIFVTQFFITKRNKIHHKEMHGALMERICLKSKCFMSLSVSAV